MIMHYKKSLWLIMLLFAPFVAAAQIDKTEVSNQQYAVYLKANIDGELPRYWGNFQSEYFYNSPAAPLAPFKKNSFTKANYPIVGISWNAASSYCKWNNQRLPTKIEWIHFAGGDDNRIWPWGNTWSYHNANTGGEYKGEHDGYVYSAPVNSFPSGRSPHGILNMAGNVAEWTFEKWVAGGSSNNSPSGVAITSGIQHEPTYRSFDIGFRCIK